jgi:tRNA (guanosine-2'-O-)-methyltransferase
MLENLISYFETFINPNRIALINKNLEQRTRYLTVILEDIYQPHNASAVLRTCECFGVQDVHVIENNNKYKLSPDVALGSEQWLTLTKYSSNKNNTEAALKNIKAQGYRIVATTPHHNDVMLDDFDLTKGKTALLFGTELNGISQPALDLCDEFVKIPMYGFTESFNISVSVAIILHHLVYKLHSSDIDWKLNNNEKIELKLKWLKNSIKKPELIEKHFYETFNK